MAAKILGIKLEVDATQGAKLAKVYEDTAVAAKNTEAALKSIDAARYAAIDKQKEAYARLSDSIARANEILSRTGNTGSGIALATRELKKYNETLEETKKALLALPKSPTPSGTGLADAEKPAPYNDGRKYTTIAESREAAKRKELEAIEALERASSERLIALSKETAAKRSTEVLRPQGNFNYSTGTSSADNAAREARIAADLAAAKKEEFAKLATIEKEYSAEVERLAKERADKLVAIEREAAARRRTIATGFAALSAQGAARNANIDAGNRLVSGMSSVNRNEEIVRERASAEARLAAYNTYIALFQERERFLSSIVGNEQTARTSLTRQGISDQERMYAELFDQIAARERAATEAARARIASQFSTLGAQGQANNSRIDAGARLTAGMTAAGQVPAQEAADRQTAINATNLASYRATLSQEEAALRNSVELQTAIQMHGIDSIQTARVRAAQQSAALEAQRQEQLARIQTRVASGAITPSAGIAAATAANRQYADAIHTVNEGLRTHGQAVAGTEEHHRNLLSRVGRIIGAYQLWMTALSYTKQALLSIPQAGIEAQANIAKVLGIFGTEEGNKSIKFVEDLALSTGNSLTGLERAYGKFAPAAALAGAKQTEVNKIFKDFAEVGTVLHLTEDKLGAVFLAIEQMYSKGVVQSEEIKKQLGNVLPAAVEIGAKAWSEYSNNGITSVAKFMAAMKKNEVDIKVFAPKFAALYRKILGGTDDLAYLSVVDQLQANLGRISTQYTLLNREIFEKTKEGMNTFVISVARVLEIFRTNLTGATQAIELFALALTARLGLALAASITGIATLGSAINRFAIVLTGLSVPALAGVSAVTLLAGKAAGLGLSYSSAEGFMVSFQDKQVSLTSFVQNYVIVVFERLVTKLENISSAVKELSGLDMKEIFSNIIPGSETLDKVSAYFTTFKQFIAAQKNGTKMFPMPGEDTVDSVDWQRRLEENLAAQLKAPSIVAEAVNKGMQQDMDAYIKSFEGKSAKLVSEAIAAKKLVRNEDITKALAHTQDIAAMPQGEVDTSPVVKEAKESKARSEADRLEQENKRRLAILIKGFKDENEARQLAIKESLEQNQNLYNMEKEDFNTYIAEKQKYERQALSSERHMLLQEKKATQDELARLEATKVPKYDAETIQNAQEILKLDAMPASSKKIVDDGFASMVREAKKVMEEVNSAKNDSNAIDTRTLDLKEKLQEITTGLADIEQRGAAISRTNAEENYKYAKEAIKNANEILLKQKEIRDGKTKEVVAATIDAQQAPVRKELTNLLNSNASPDDKKKASNALDALNAQRMHDINQADLDMKHEQRKALDSIAEGYKNVGITAADVIGSQITGLQAVVTAVDAFSNSTKKVISDQKDLKDKMETTANMLDGPAKQREIEKDNATQIALSEQLTKSRLTGVSKIMSATSKMFKEGSKEAAIANSLAAGFTLAQQIRELTALPVKGAQVVLNAGASGDGYTAIARMAAVAATVAALISSVGGAFGGLSGGGNTSSTAMPESNGQGTTLGDTSKESTSIADSLSSLSGINYKSYSELVKLNSTVSSITDNIIKVATLNAQGKLTSVSPITPAGGFTAMGKVVQGIVDITTAYMTLGLSQILKKLPVIGNILSGIDNFITSGLFGKTTAKITAQGFTTGIQSAAKILIGVSASLQEFYTVEEKTKSWFSSSTKIYDKTQAASKAAVNVFTNLFRSVAEASKALAETVGAGFVDAVYRYKFPAIKIDVKGKTSEQIITKLNQVMSAQLDKMTTKVFGQAFGDLQALGEGMFATVNRLYAEKAVVTKSFKFLGTSIPTDTIAFIRLADSLTQASSNADTAAGRLKDFATQEETFYKSFASTSRQSSDNLQNLVEQLNGVFSTAFSTDQVAKVKAYSDSVTANAKNPAITVKPVESFKTLEATFLDTLRSTGDFNLALIKLKGSIDLTSKKGVEAYASINSLTDIAKTYSDTLDGMKKPIQDQIDSIKDTIDLRSQEELTKALAASTDFDQQKKLSAKIQKLVVDKYNTELQAINSIKSSFTALADYVKGLLLGDLSTLTPKQKFEEAKNQFDQTLADIASKDKTISSKAAANLQNVSNNYLTQARAYLGYTVGYGAIFDTVVATSKKFAQDAIDSTGTLADTVTQSTIDVATSAITQLTDLSTTLTGAAIKTFTDLLAQVQSTQKATDTTAAAAPKSTLEGLYNDLAGSTSKAQTALVNKQISAYNAGFAKQGQSGADLALAAERDREKNQADLATAKAQLAAEKKKKKALQNAELIKTLQGQIDVAKANIAKDTKQLKTVGFKASGGIVDTDLTVVGEKGMELLNLPKGTSVSSNNSTNSIISQSNKKVVDLNEAMLAELKTMNERLAYLERKVAIGKPNLVRG